jgi:probable F420-dependent oxidoreductase
MTGVGLCLPQLGPHVARDVIVEFCREAQRHGYTSLWVQDHFLWPVNPKRGYAGRPGLPIPTQYRSVFAPTELLAAAAVLTEGMQLGTSVLVQGNHWPSPLAQRLATLDQLSTGRLLVGLGQGWNVEEHEASGTRIGERARRMDDFVAALRACWGPDPVHHDGPFFTIPEAIQRPKPLQQPHPPLLSGASSPAGLARTAELFDGWNPAGIGVEAAARTYAQLCGQRPAHLAPLSVYLRTFVQFLGPAEPTGAILERLHAEARGSAAEGFAELVIEHNFWDGIASPDDWVAVPGRFASVVEAARGTAA